MVGSRGGVLGEEAQSRGRAQPSCWRYVCLWCFGSSSGESEWEELDGQVGGQHSRPERYTSVKRVYLHHGVSFARLVLCSPSSAIPKAQAHCLSASRVPVYGPEQGHELEDKCQEQG